jgi:dihydroxy-acid dehydratase
VPQRSINVKLSDAELAERKKSWKPLEPRFLRGYGVMFSRHITQANKGCDFDFLQGTLPTAEPEIH